MIFYLHRMNRVIFSILLLGYSFSVWGQVDTLPFQPEDLIDSDQLEDFIQSQDSDNGFDFNTLYEQLEIYKQKPLNINKANQQELLSLNLLSDSQILQLLSYRQRYGELIALEELQAVPGFDLETIRKINPFVRVKGGLDDTKVPIRQMMAKGRRELFTRWERRLQLAKGFNEDDEGNTPFIGDPNKFYLRYRHRFENRLSYGLTAEKDPGEEFLTGSNQMGFDYYSFHFFVQKYSKRLKYLALGDFQASFGQGLLLFSGFGRTKGINTMNIKRDAPVLKAYTGADENNFLRGAGVTLQLNDELELTAFASSRTRDANLLQSDTLDQEETNQQFSSFQGTGFHRTQGEIEDEKALRQNTVGARLVFAKSNFKVALNGLFDRFDKSLDRTIVPYNQFYFKGQQIANASLDYSYIFRNFNFFGETATSSNGRIATTNGLLMTLDRNIDFSVLYRHFPKDYNALNANPLAETRGGQNETGLYLGTIVRFNQHWRFNAYFDTWRHPWLRFGVDAPSIGHEYRARLTYYRKRKLTAFAEIKMEVKEHNAPDPEARFDYLVKRQLLQGRFQINAQLNKTVELRSRVDAGYYDNGFDTERETGFAVFQDIIFKPTNLPISFSSRFALFDTESFNMRFYAYENDLLYSFSIPPYFGRGNRFYLNLRYRGIRNLTVELRYARTKFIDREEIGSGVNEILGSVRTDVKAQVSYRF